MEVKTMTLKVNDTELFSLSMTLEILWDLEQINICVKLWNKTTHKVKTKFFPAADFDAALKYYNEQEKFFF
jgi:hypothetical protein